MEDDGKYGPGGSGCDGPGDDGGDADDANLVRNMRSDPEGVAVHKAFIRWRTNLAWRADGHAAICIQQNLRKRISYLHVRVSSVSKQQRAQ